MSITAMKQMVWALESVIANHKGAPVLDWTEALKAGRQAIEQAEKNQFNPDWDAMAVMVEEQQRMAKRIEELEQAEKQEPKPCPTCEALARTVMMDQTGRDA